METESLENENAKFKLESSRNISETFNAISWDSCKNIMQT